MQTYSELSIFSSLCQQDRTRLNAGKLFWKPARTYSVLRGSYATQLGYGKAKPVQWNVEGEAQDGGARHGVELAILSLYRRMANMEIGASGASDK